MDIITKMNNWYFVGKMTLYSIKNHQANYHNTADYCAICFGKDIEFLMSLWITGHIIKYGILQMVSAIACCFVN